MTTGKGNSRNFFYMMAGLCLLGIASVDAAELDDRFTALRKEEIDAKQAQADEIASKITVMQTHLEEDRKNTASAQEKIWQEYTQSLEMERKKLKDQMSVLDERQKMFEGELNKKREQDTLMLQEKESDVKRLILSVERLRSELEEDRKVFEEQASAAKQRASLPPVGDITKSVGGSEVPSETLSNGQVKMESPSSGAFAGKEFSLRAVRTEYYVEIGDILDVDVWRVPDLSRSVPVRPDGRISMPVVGDLEVEGLSLVQVRELLTKKFSEYVWSPQVSLSIRQFGGRKFVILGEVSGPGVYRFESEISLLEAIALAGGFKDYSRRGKVMVIRGDIRKEPQVKIINANMENVLKKGMLSENISIRPNDIIYVGKDIVGGAKEVIDDIVSPFFDTALDYFVFKSATRADHNS